MVKKLSVSLCVIAFVFSSGLLMAGDVLYDWETTLEGWTWVDNWNSGTINSVTQGTNKAFHGMGAIEIDVVYTAGTGKAIGKNISTTLQHNFETDIEGWENFAWGQAQVTLDTSSEQAHKGTYSLKAKGILSGEGEKWEFGKSATIDLSDVSVIRTWIYLSDPTGLQSKLFGQDMSWGYQAGTENMSLVTGWNELLWDVSELDGLRSFGVQVYRGSGASADSDSVYVDQIEFFEFDLSDAQWLTLDVYFPDNFQAGGGKFFIQDAGWGWADCGWMASQSGWNTWYWNVEGMDLSLDNINRIGVETFSDSALTGLIYIDNFQVHASEPTFKKASRITTLYNFEASISGWDNFAWGQAQVTLSQSDSVAIDGDYSLGADGILAGDGEKWEFGVQTTLDLATLNTNYVRAQIYVPDPDSLESKLFGQDADWTYTDGTPNKNLVAGWNQIFWDIREVANPFRSFGVQVYCSGGAYTGSVFVDNVQLSSEILDQPFIPAEGPLPLFSFEDGTVEGWAEYSGFGGGSIVDIDTSTDNSRDGLVSLLAQLDQEKNHFGVTYPMGSELDLINYASIEAWVHIPAGFPDWNGGKLIGEFNGEEVAAGWHGTDQNDDQWHKFTWNIKDLPGRSRITMLGVEIWIGGGPGSTQDILVDRVVAYPATRAGATETVASIDFENPLDLQFIDLPWGQLPTTLSHTTEYVWTGTGGLDINGQFYGFAGEKWEVACDEELDFMLNDSTPATYVIAQVFIPDPTDLQVKLFGQFGPGWTYIGGGDILLPIAGWNEIAWDLTDIPIEDLSSVHNFGLQVFSNGSVYNGSVYLDELKAVVQEIPEVPEVIDIGNVPMVTLLDFEAESGDPTSYDWNGIVATEMVLSTDEAWKGTSALKVTADFASGDGLNIGWELVDDETDMSQYKYVTARIYLPDATGMGGKMWGKWGADSSWGEGPYVSFVDGWNVLNMPVQGDTAYVLGGQVWTTSSTYSGPIYIDYVTGSRYEAVGLASDIPDTSVFHLVDGFEIVDSTYAWEAGAAGDSLFVSSEIVAADKHAVQVMVDWEDGVYGAVKFTVLPEIGGTGLDWSEADSVVFWAYYPGTGTEDEFIGISPSFKIGPGYSWTQNWQPFYPGYWNKVVFLTDTSFAEVHQIGVQLSNMEAGAVGSEYYGPIFIDHFGYYHEAYVEPEPETVYVGAGVDTLSTVLADAIDGDVFILESDSGLYVETNTIIIDKDITIIAAEGLENPPIWTTGGTHHIELSSNLMLKGIIFGSAGTTEGALYNTALEPNNINIDSCVFINMTGDAIGADSTATVDSLQVTNSLFTQIDAGIKLSGNESSEIPGVNYLFVENCTFYNLAIGIFANGFRSDTDSSVAFINHVTIYNGQLDGINIGAFGAGTTIKNSIITDCTNQGVFAHAGSPMAVTYSDVWNNGTNYSDDASAGTGSISGDPEFADPDNGIFDLALEWSPCIGTAGDGQNMGDLRWVVVDLSIDQENLPTEFSLSQNYPNPFNPVTTIKYGLKEEVHTRLTLYNVLGQEVITLVNETQPTGYYFLNWNGRNKYGASISSGIYFYRLEAGDFVSVKKLTILK